MARLASRIFVSLLAFALALPALAAPMVVSPRDDTEDPSTTSLAFSLGKDGPHASHHTPADTRTGPGAPVTATPSPTTVASSSATSTATRPHLEMDWLS